MRIMITGAEGQLGSSLLRQLQQGGCSIGSLLAPYYKAEVFCQNYPQFDLTSADSINQAVQECLPDLVIHCAANTAVDQCEQKPELAFAINAEGTRILAKACEKYGARMIYVSSDYVFNGEAKIPYQESDCCDPQSVYGKSKWLGEQYAQEECSRVVILRTAWMYGFQGSNFVKTILQKGKEGKRFSVVDDQWGSPSNAEDVAYYLLQLAVQTDVGIYHCAGGGECTWFQFANAILKEANLSCEIIPCSSKEYPSNVPRPRYSVLNSQKLLRLLNCAPRHWELSLKAYISQLEGIK